jgi:TolA-binding protein
MVSLEQVKLLETKVARTIDYVERVAKENAVLQEKLDSYQQRIDELEVLVQRFKEDQGRIEDGILSALDRLNQFEDAIEKSLAARESSDSPAEATAPEAPPPEPSIVALVNEAGPAAAPEVPPSEPENAEEEVLAGEDEKNAATNNGELDIF